MDIKDYMHTMSHQEQLFWSRLLKNEPNHKPYLSEV